MAPKVKEHGARVYIYDNGVILVKQTIKNPKTGRYVVDTDPVGNHRERHIDANNDKALADALRLAGDGRL